MKTSYPAASSGGWMKASLCHLRHLLWGIGLPELQNIARGLSTAARRQREPCERDETTIAIDKT